MSAVEPTLTDLERERLAAAWSDETGSPLWASLQNTVARMLAAARADERDRLTHTVHVTARPIAEDVVWCDECEEWVESSAPERAALAQTADTKAADR